MPNLKNIVAFEKSIRKNKRAIAKKKKTIPFYVLIIVLIYALLFNISGHKLKSLFDNQLDFIETLSYIFMGIISIYFTYIFYTISRLSKQTKEWNKSLYKISKLNEENVSFH